MLVNVLQFLNSPDITSTPVLDHDSCSSDSAADMKHDTRYMRQHSLTVSPVKVPDGGMRECILPSAYGNFLDMSVLVVNLYSTKLQRHAEPAAYNVIFLIYLNSVGDSFLLRQFSVRSAEICQKVKQVGVAIM